MLSCLTSRSGLWHWHREIHPDVARATLWHGADRGPVQVHLPVCVWVHTDHQGQRLRLLGEQQRQKRKKNLSCGSTIDWYREERSRFQENNIEICRSVGLCSFDCSRPVQCQQNMLSERCLWKMNVDRETEKKQPHRLNQSYLKCLCFFFPQETDTEYGNLQLKHQPASRKVSKWVGVCMSLCMTLCVHWISLIHSHDSSKCHTYFSFQKHDLASSVFMSAVAFCREELRLEGGCIVL